MSGAPCVSLCVSYLKLRPVHGHAGAVAGAEPPEVLLSVGRLDGVFQCVIDGRVPEEETRLTTTSRLSQLQGDSSQRFACWCQ